MGIYDFLMGSPQGTQGSASYNIPQPAQSGALDQLGDFLSHPAVQGLLGAYFGAVSSPRHGGFGQAIGRGGLMGLGMANQAQLLRSQLPLQQAELALARQQVPEAQARTAYLQAERPLAQARATSLQPIGPQAAGRIAQQNPEFAKVVGPENLATQTWTEINKMYDDFLKRQQEQPKITAETEAAGTTAALRKGQLGALGSLERLRGSQTEALNRGMALMPTALPGTEMAAPATSVEPATAPEPTPPTSAGEATHEQDFVGPDGKKVTMRLIGGKWQPAT